MTESLILVNENATFLNTLGLQPSVNPLSGLPANAPTIQKKNKRLRSGLVHYDNLINAEIISALSIDLTLLKT